MERVWQRQYANHAEAKADITDYIVGFYNYKRINSALGNLPPSVYEQKMAERELSLCPKLLDHRTTPEASHGRVVIAVPRRDMDGCMPNCFNSF